jgi:hypothetical protein
MNNTETKTLLVDQLIANWRDSGLSMLEPVPSDKLQILLESERAPIWYIAILAKCGGMTDGDATADGFCLWGIDRVLQNLETTGRLVFADQDFGTWTLFFESGKHDVILSESNLNHSESWPAFDNSDEFLRHLVDDDIYQSLMVSLDRSRAKDK